MAADMLVVKIKYDEVLRRFSLPKSPSPTYGQLMKKVHDLFSLSNSANLAITYVDDEGDVVTMSDDQDVQDAVALQGLNPLRLTVKKTFNHATDSRAKFEASTKPPTVAADSLSELADDIAKTMKAAWKEAAARGQAGDVKKAVEAFEPVLKTAPQKMAEVLDLFLKSGFTASLEPSFSMNHEACDSDSSGLVFSKPTGQSEDVKKGSASDTKVEGEASKDSEGEAPKDSEESKVEKKTDLDEPRETQSALPQEKVFHTGVQCDVCDMLPIAGIRYQSTKKNDYDLCSTCFAVHGVEGDYNKIERPVFRAHPPWTRGPNRSHGHPCHPRWPPQSPCSRGYSFSAGRASGCGRSLDHPPFEGTLDALFVSDVTIFDGTELPPGTPFTKIWRLRNIGTVPWPRHTRLVHAGGDHFGHKDFVGVAVPEGGLSPGAEVEVSVDMVAPAQPGQYVSHWKLMAPGGKRFGHRLWALIQVVPQNEPSPQVAESVAELAKSNDSADLQGRVVPTPSQEAVSQGSPQPEADLDSPTTEKTSVGGFSLVDRPLVEQEEPVEAPVLVKVEEAAGVKRGESAEADMEGVMQVEVVDLSSLPVHVVGGEEVLVEKEKAMSEEEVEVEAKLEQLQAMGFKDRVVNYELLKQHEFDVERTLEKLLAAAEWDPMLKELEEMGFNDSTTNRLLMMKNNGSVKLVVKELVQKYKEQK